MEITLEWIGQNFERFNHQYFDGKLPTPIFQIIRARAVFGQCSARGRKSPRFYIRLSVYFERTEYEYQNTLLHEMIHLCLFCNKEWKVSHGEKFIAIASRINKDGWDIKVSRKGGRKKLESKEAELQRKLKQINTLHKRILGRPLYSNQEK